MSEAGVVTIDGAAIKKFIRRYGGLIWPVVCLFGCLAVVGIAILISVAMLKNKAVQGDVLAQRQLCMRYSQHERYEKSARWCRLAAEQGDPIGQGELGALYERGTGVPRDPDEAFRLIKLAAEAHYRGAQVYLSRLYRMGIGVETDDVAAYMWADIAVHNPSGNTSGMQSSLSVMLSRDLLLDVTEEQKEEGLRASLEWRKEHPEYMPDAYYWLATTEDMTDDARVETLDALDQTFRYTSDDGHLRWHFPDSSIVERVDAENWRTVTVEEDT